MSYKAKSFFRDMQDGGYAYNVGDEYPRKGYKPTDERIAELSGNGNKRGVAVIEKIAVEPINEEPIVAPKRGRKKK